MASHNLSHLISLDAVLTIIGVILAGVLATYFYPVWLYHWRRRKRSRKSRRSKQARQAESGKTSR
jgi:hypothetical protein